MTYNRLNELRDVTPELNLGKVQEVQEDSLALFLKDYTSKIQNVEKEFDDLKSRYNKIKDLHTKSLSSTVQKQKKEIKDELSKAMTSASKKNKEISKSIQLIADENEKRKNEITEENSAEMRIRISQHVQLCNQFKDTIQEFQEIQEKFKKENTDRQKRSLKMANPKLNDQEIEQIVVQGGDEDAYKKKIGLNKSQQGTLSTYYDDAIETRKDVQQIEQNLIELQDLFVSMAQLVSQQQDLMDNIENSVGSAEENNRIAIDNVQGTKEHQEKSRVLMIVIVLIVIIFVVVAILVAAGVTGGVLLGVLRKA